MVSRPGLIGMIVPPYPCDRSMRCGRAVFLVASPDAPTSAIAFGANSASNSFRSRSMSTSRALGETTIEDRLRDPVEEHFDRTAGDHPATRTSQAVLDD